MAKLGIPKKSADQADPANPSNPSLARDRTIRRTDRSSRLRLRGFSATDRSDTEVEGH